MRYPRQTMLHHHAGSEWKVIRYTPEGDYRIKCVVGTVRPDRIGGEVEGSVRQVHPDYLHGDGWTVVSRPAPPATDQERSAVALPLATTNANRCTHKRENGHRCALPVAHASEHFYRQDGLPWRGEKAATDQEREGT